MAARLGIVAARDGIEAFQQHFRMLDRIAPTTTSGWTWAGFSLFGYGSLIGPQAEAILRALQSPGLQAWTEDGALWYLMLYAPGQEPFRHVHWFRYNRVANGLEKGKKGQTLRQFLDEYEDGLPEDYKCAGILPEGALRTAMREFLRQRADALSEFLRACEVPHDGDAVRAAITGESVTPEEWDWDVGNLPRVLEAIGLEDAVPGWKEQIDEDRRSAAGARAAAEEDRNAPPPDLVEPILRCLTAGVPVPIRGGSVVTFPSTLWLLPWSCETDLEIGFLVRPSRRVKIRWPHIELLSAVERDGVWRLGYPWCSVWQRDRLILQLQAAFVRLPAGSTIEMVSASEPEPSDDGSAERAGTAASQAGNMRFRGVLHRGAWKVTDAYPAVTKKDLTGALEIFEWVSRRDPFRARSTAEATTIVQRALASGVFGQDKKDRPVASGSLVRIASRKWRHYLAQTIFRHRFSGGPWDVLSGEQADQEMSADLDALFAGIAEKVTQAFAVPRGPELVHQGKRAAFRHADIFQVGSGPRLIELFRMLYPGRDFGESLDLPTAVRLVDESMTHLGFTLLGDMVCEAFGDIVLRGNGRKDGGGFGLLYAGTLGQFLYEFYTDFTDGSSLTTSIHHGKSRREMKIFHAQYANAPVEDLFEKHRAGVALRSNNGVTPADHPPTLSALAARIDGFLTRTAA